MLCNFAVNLVIQAQDTTINGILPELPGKGVCLSMKFGESWVDKSNSYLIMPKREESDNKFCSEHFSMCIIEIVFSSLRHLCL